ncbi:hypothetical protein F4779DRAFT_24216 [Xylariaceae sp. FL0662B]|nr:hypothetical protein F4779DRAFT_24216 [Xylariaceae sp. FL0662B]
MADFGDSDYSADPLSSSSPYRSATTISGTSTGTDLESILSNSPSHHPPAYRFQQHFDSPMPSDEESDLNTDFDQPDDDLFLDDDPFGDSSTDDDDNNQHQPFNPRNAIVYDDLEEDGLFVGGNNNINNNGNNNNNTGDIGLAGPGNRGGTLLDHHHHHHHQHPDRSSPSPGFWRIRIGSPPFDNLQLGMDHSAHRRNELRDELVEMEMEMDMQMQGQGNRRGNQGNGVQMPQVQPPVIDLTGDDGEPENPPRRAPVGGPRNRSQNERRRRSQQRSTPPRLARSDADYMGNRTVINLISDSDDDEPAVMPRPTRNANNNAGQGARNSRPAEQFHPFHSPSPVPNYRDVGSGRNALHQIQNLFQNIPILRFLNNPQAPQDEDIVMVGQRNIMPPGLPHPNLAPVHLDYIAHPFANAQHIPGMASPKPAHEPPKEARDGFTRNTGEEVVAICASCEEELAYDPDADDHPQTPAKKARTKKDKAEHHFWAVKACGHVYCKKCYENRKPAARNPVLVGFRPDPKGAKNKMLCAVEDCDTDVGPKAAWVGIFV